MDPLPRRILLTGLLFFPIALGGAGLSFLHLSAAHAWINDVGATMVLLGGGVTFLCAVVGAIVAIVQDVRRRLDS